MSTDTDSSSSVLGFKQLDDTNYSIWVQRMTDALAKKKYWRYAQGTEEKPELDVTITYADTAAGRQVQASALKALKKELKEWCNDLWLQLMTVSLCDGLIRRMYVERERENSAHERGRAYFARPSRVSQLSLALGHVSLPLIRYGFFPVQCRTAHAR